MNKARGLVCPVVVLNSDENPLAKQNHSHNSRCPLLSSLTMSNAGMSKHTKEREGPVYTISSASQSRDTVTVLAMSVSIVCNRLLPVPPPLSYPVCA
jgi:hypothetical protein